MVASNLCINFLTPLPNSLREWKKNLRTVLTTVLRFNIPIRKKKLLENVEHERVCAINVKIVRLHLTMN